jgi:hypothetical protein
MYSICFKKDIAKRFYKKPCHFGVVSYKRSRWPKNTASQIEKETVYYRAKTPRRQDYLSFKSFPL